MWPGALYIDDNDTDADADNTDADADNTDDNAAQLH